MIPCYVSGKGMYAGEATRDFKVMMISLLESSGLGYDTRFRYYRRQFSDLALDELARKVCDPIEYYDRDWPAWRAAQPAGEDEDQQVTRFFLARDTQFRAEARAAIYCFDEAGFGSGVNVMRFIHERKPLLGFYQKDLRRQRVNVGNVLQLAQEFPDLVDVRPYERGEDMPEQVRDWLLRLRDAEWTTHV